jgi:hypothetical protein
MKHGKRVSPVYGERGTAMVAVLMLGLVLVPLAILAYLTANVEMVAEANKLHADQTFALGEAGHAYGIDWLFKQDPPPQPADGAPVYLGEFQMGTIGTYEVWVDPADTNDYTGDGPWVYQILGVGHAGKTVGGP